MYVVKALQLSLGTTLFRLPVNSKKHAIFFSSEYKILVSFIHLIIINHSLIIFKNKYLTINIYKLFVHITYLIWIYFWNTFSNFSKSSFTSSWSLGLYLIFYFYFFFTHSFTNYFVLFLFFIWKTILFLISHLYPWKLPHISFCNDVGNKLIN